MKKDFKASQQKTKKDGELKELEDKLVVDVAKNSDKILKLAN
jgi:hypothetical protein